MSKIKMLLAAAMLAAPLPAAAVTFDLSATDYDKSMYTYDFDPGSYTVSLIDGKYTAWSPILSDRDPKWVAYFQYEIGGVINSTFTNAPGRFRTPQLALSAFSAPGPLKLDFTRKTAVTFAIQDSPSSFWDNSGGLSLAVTAVPEPATWGMMVLGFLGMGAALRTKRGRKAAVA
jgi:hypothetical protein